MGLASIAKHGKGRSLPAGALFACAMLALAVGAQFAGQAWPTALGLACFLLGLPHGAGDDDGQAIRRWSAPGIIAYLVVASALAFLFLAAPLAGLTAFLLLSAWHFADGEGAPGWALGLIAVGGSALFQGGETAAIFAAITGAAIPPPFMIALAMLGGVGVGVTLYVLVADRTRAVAPLAALSFTALFAPVLAVGLVFLLLHAQPMLERQLDAYGSGAVWRAGGGPTLAALLGSVALVALVLGGLLALPLAAALALALATPHMLSDRIAA